MTTQPSLIARMVAALGLTGSERVLEVGTGLGFQTAILARLARQVVSVERFPDLAEQALANLAAAGLDRVRVVVRDGTLGVPDAWLTPAYFVPLAGVHGIGTRQGRDER